MRTTDLDPDFRRNPKTWHFCYVCQRDLNPNKPYRMVAIDPDCNLQGVHPDDAGDDCERFPVGSDCAKRIGLEWTSEPSASQRELAYTNARTRATTR